MTLPDPSFMPLGIISISITWIGLLFLLYKWRGNKSMSFSLHAAQTRGGQVYYFLLFIITLPMFYLFVSNWYVQELKLPSTFTLLVAIGILGQIAAVIIPSVGGRKERIHNFGAYLMSATLIPLSAMVAIADIPIGVKVFAGLGTAYMITVSILFITTKRLRSNYLYFQAAYVIAFHSIILASTYIR